MVRVICVLLKLMKCYSNVIISVKYVYLTLKMPSPIFRYFHPKISLLELFCITNATNLLFIFTICVNVKTTQDNFVLTYFFIKDYLQVI